tara:strand:+ start:147 stop:359 length:213 start_codon:yes stop_codon:yes gene_type:complete
MFFVEIKFDDKIIHTDKYNSLAEISKKLGMSYQQVADINCGRFNPKFINKNFIYQPKIHIQRIKNELIID